MEDWMLDLIVRNLNQRAGKFSQSLYFEGARSFCRHPRELNVIVIHIDSGKVDCSVEETGDRILFRFPSGSVATVPILEFFGKPN